MKTKLLKKLRNIGRNEINIYSVTKEDGCAIGMKIGYNSDIYSGIFSFGDTKEDVENKAAKIYLHHNIGNIRKKYKKYKHKQG